MAQTPTKRKHRKGSPPRSPSPGVLGTRARKLAAALGAAVLAGIGGLIASAIWRGTGKVLHPSGPALRVHVIPTGTYQAGALEPYFIVPDKVAPGPGALPRAARNHPVTFIDPTWARAHGAVAGSPQVIRLRLQGMDDRPVIVNGITALVTKRSNPVQGWYAAVVSGCGEAPVRVGSLDLDHPSRPVASNQYGVKISAPKQYSLSVTRTDVELVQLEAFTSNAASWKIRVDYSATGGDGSVTLDDHGQPFRVSSEDPSRGYEVTYSVNPSRTNLVREHNWDERGITVC